MSIISKELLSEVLGVYVRDGWYFDYELLIYTYDKILGLDENYHSQINIYELVHKCKEWASNNQFTLVSGDSGHGFVCSVGHYSNNAINAEFYEENEFNAVIQGCEWILKETNNATN